ncbi:transcription factor btf3 [Reticulomyxa filosa]|uniref:Nascent polypeptide-associated complex subunit beta n=1 Tax=Reticulomyxa filosa TaxID=46433 RepID=X6NA03_RETFI|nr:transcription factor btf3 [Reticulomyxa filosa]|eukprot:ETO22584.1 transcription factor btf3 [Reticulomyxa filosa]
MSTWSKLSKENIQERLKKTFENLTTQISGKKSKEDEKPEKEPQNELQKLNLRTLPSIEEVNLFKDDGTVIHFKKPKGNDGYTKKKEKGSTASHCGCCT